MKEVVYLPLTARLVAFVLLIIAGLRYWFTWIFSWGKSKRLRLIDLQGQSLFETTFYPWKEVEVSYKSFVVELIVYGAILYAMWTSDYTLCENVALPRWCEK